MRIEWALLKVGQPKLLSAVLMIYNCDSSKTTNEFEINEKKQIKAYLVNKFISNNNSNVHLD